MDIELYYQEEGNGESFIFLHGNGENSSYFKKQIDYFQSKYRVIALDTRGHGKSPRGKAPFTIEQFACDLYDFMTSHRISSAVILGFSDGANLNAKGVKRTIQIPIEIGYKIAKRFATKSPDAKRNAEMLGLMVNEPNIKLCELSQITSPTLVVCGTRDMIKESHTKEIATSISNAKLTIIKGNHFIANKCHAEFNQAVDDFLKTI